MIEFNWSSDIKSVDTPQNRALYEEQDEMCKKYFNHIEYLKACAEIFSKREAVKVLSIYDQNKIIGLWVFRETPLTLRKITTRFWVPVTFRISEYNLPIIKKGQEANFFIGLNLALANHSIFVHNLLPLHSLWFTNNVKKSFVYNSSYNPVLKKVNDSIIQASQKKGLVRDYKSLKKNYTTEINHHYGNIEEELVRKFFTLHIKRWKTEGIQSKFNQSEFQDLYLKLSKLELKGIGMPVLSEIIVNGKIMAMHYGFVIDDVFLYQIPAFDPEFKKMGPGTILLKSILDFCVEQDLSSFDMGYGVEHYKFRYMNSVEVYESVLRHKNSVLNFLFRIKK